MFFDDELDKIFEDGQEQGEHIGTTAKKLLDACWKNAMGDGTIPHLREKLSLLGWRPASERPKVGEDGDVEVIVIQDNYNVDKAIYCEIEGIGMWDLPNIKWWCYPPKEE